MATFNRFNAFAEHLANGTIDMFGTEHTFKVLLTNTVPNQSTAAVKADITEISAGNGYSAGGVDIDNDGSRTTNVVTVTAVDKVITASGGSIGPFRYAVLYDDTPTSPADPLIGYWDYGSSITLADGETLTLDFGASLLTHTAS